MDSLQKLLEEMINSQEKKLMAIAEKIRPNITSDDLLQPFDYKELDFHPLFRHEEGILEGLKMVDTAFKSLRNDL
jgi:hypothetical protein